MENREKNIIKTSIIGILVNIVLAIFKAVVGLLSHSIAITLDAINNLSDALSSLITIVGTKLSMMRPNKKHPLGYGRIEYLTAAIIACLVLYAGITSLIESIKTIINPGKPHYSLVTLFIVFVGVITKIILGEYTKKQGKRLHSDSLINSGEDARFDAIISSATLLAAILFIFTSFSIEAYLAAVISIFIIKSGIDMLKNTLSDLLGERIDPSLSKKIKEIVNQEEGVQGSYDLLLHAYGPDRYQGSIHVEVEDTMSINEFDTLSRNITNRVIDETGVILTGIGLYSINTKDPLILDAKEKLKKVISEHEGILGFHGFYLNKEERFIQVDLIFSFDVEDCDHLVKIVEDEMKNYYPDYTFNIQIDLDISN